MSMQGDLSWRCAEQPWRFCPEEGCPKSYCARRDDKWKLGQPSPVRCTGLKLKDEKNGVK